MTIKQYSLSSGNVIQVTRHEKTEIPRFYPEKIIRLKNGTVGLVNPHSKYYESTPENQRKLEKNNPKSPLLVLYQLPCKNKVEIKFYFGR